MLNKACRPRRLAGLLALILALPAADAEAQTRTAPTSDAASRAPDTTSAPAQQNPAGDVEHPQWQVHGFAAQGFVLSDGNNVNGTSADGSGSARYQEFGLNASWRAHGAVLLSGQVASVRAGAATDEYLQLEYALVDYMPWQRATGRAGLRAGKLKLPIGFYNESRDAVFTRPSVLLPQGVYLDTSGAREFGYFSSWGASLYADWYRGEHAFYLEGGGFPRQALGDNADVAILRTAASGEFEVDQGFLLRLGHEHRGGKTRAALSLMEVKVDYEAGTQGTFTQDGSLHFEQAVLSLQHNWPRFSLTTEFVARTFQLDELVGAPLNALGVSSNVDLTPIGGYAQGTWRITPKSSAFLRYDQQIRDSGDRHGHEQARRSAETAATIEAVTGQPTPSQPRHYFFAHDWTVGGRHDFNDKLSLLAEFHYVDGVAWVNPLDNPSFERGGAERYWNLFTVMLGYQF